MCQVSTNNNTNDNDSSLLSMSLGHSKDFIHIFPYNNSEADNYEFSHLADENIEQIVIMLLAQDHTTNNG